MIQGIVNQTATVPITLLDADGNAVTGATVTATARLAGSATTAVVSVTERTEGDYDAAFTPSAAGAWQVRWSAVIGGETVPDGETVQVVTAAQADPAASLAAGSVTVTSPVATTGDATVYQGDDQVAAASRSLDWATTSAGDWPDLTDAGIAMQGQHQAARAVTFGAAGSVVTPTGATKAVRVELAHAATAAMRPGKYDIQVIATLSGGEVVTLAAASLTVVERVGD